MATGARMLLLDEPAAGMNPNETHEITELIGRLRDERGYTILVIEHDMHVVEGISDRVVALDHGEKLAEGTFDEVANHPDVIEAYLGATPRTANERARHAAARDRAAGTARRRCSSSTTSRRTTGRCGSSRASRCRSSAGELVCLLGGNASGKSTTLKTILGIVRPRSGRVLIDGQDVNNLGVPGGSRAAWRSSPRTAACSAS